jgi:diphthamide biosynthesis methyltransferase
MLEALGAVCRAQLLEEEGAEAYHFLHDVTREVVEADLGAARRMVLHRRVAEVLERQPGDPLLELLAYHYSRSEAHDKAVLYLEQAGDRAWGQYASAAAEG